MFVSSKRFLIFLSLVDSRAPRVTHKIVSSLESSFALMLFSINKQKESLGANAKKPCNPYKSGEEFSDITMAYPATIRALVAMNGEYSHSLA